MQYGLINMEGSLSPSKSCREADTINRIYLIALLLLFLMIIVRTILTLSNHMAGGTVNVFEQSSIRYALTFFVTGMAFIVRQEPLKVDRKYVPLILLATIFNLLTMILGYFSISFMPVGNYEVLYVGLNLCFATVIDFHQRVIKLTTTLASAVMIIGLVCVAQPWQNIVEKKAIGDLPCAYWQAQLSPNTVSEQFLLYIHR